MPYHPRAQKHKNHPPPPPKNPTIGTPPPPPPPRPPPPHPPPPPHQHTLTPKKTQKNTTTPPFFCAMTRFIHLPVTTIFANIETPWQASYGAGRERYDDPADCLPIGSLPATTIRVQSRLHAKASTRGGARLLASTRCTPVKFTCPCCRMPQIGEPARQWVNNTNLVGGGGTGIHLFGGTIRPLGGERNSQRETSLRSLSFHGG